MEEILPIVDEKGNVTGKASRKKCHSGSFILHPVVHIHLINEERLYLQKRSYDKDIQPGKWDTSVGGHIMYGDDPLTSAQREAEEELGIKTGLNLIPVCRYVWQSEVEKEYYHVFKSYRSGEIKIDNYEVIDGKYWEREEINKSIGKGIFTPNFEYEYTLLQDKLFDKSFKIV